MTPAPDERSQAPAPFLPLSEAEARCESLDEKLNLVIASLPGEGVTLAVILDRVGHDGLLLITVLLTLVFMIPVSIPGVSTVFGAAILLIGISRLRDRKLWLPQRVAHRVLPVEKLRAGLRQGSIWLHRLERISRPQRLNWLATGQLAATLNNSALVLGAVLLMAPLGFVPFSNTLPALALLFLAIGLLRRDGVCILLGHLANLATLVYFAALAIGGSVAIREALRRLACLWS